MKMKVYEINYYIKNLRIYFYKIEYELLLLYILLNFYFSIFQKILINNNKKLKIKN